jgi:hypothetical protein
MARGPWRLLDGDRAAVPETALSAPAPTRRRQGGSRPNQRGQGDRRSWTPRRASACGLRPEGSRSCATYVPHDRCAVVEGESSDWVAGEQLACANARRCGGMLDLLTPALEASPGHMRLVGLVRAASGCPPGGALVMRGSSQVVVVVPRADSNCRQPALGGRSRPLAFTQFHCATIDLAAEVPDDSDCFPPRGNPLATRLHLMPSRHWEGAQTASQVPPKHRIMLWLTLSSCSRPDAARLGGPDLLSRRDPSHPKDGHQGRRRVKSDVRGCPRRGSQPGARRRPVPNARSVKTRSRIR